MPTVADSINLISVIITAIATLASIVLGIKGYQLQQRNLHLQQEMQKQKGLNERELEKLRDKIDKFKKDIQTYTWPDDPLVADIFFLGPRASGKSSIVQLWKKWWTDITRIPATTTWDEYSITVDEVKEKKRKIHPQFEVECNFERVLKLRLHDYAGEDSLRVTALQELEKLDKRALIVFVMKVGYANGRISFTDDNASYFSTQFVQIVNECIKNIASSVVKVIVVFNKIDLLPAWDAPKMMTELKSANADAVGKIDSVFSPSVIYKLTSARTNYGLIDLFGTITMALATKDTEEFKFFDPNTVFYPETIAELLEKHKRRFWK